MSALAPSLPDIGLCTARELKTLAVALDYLIQGKLAEGMDVLAQRFRAVEAATSEGWSIARHHELIDDGRVTTVPQEFREAAARLENHDQRHRALVQKAKDRKPG